MSIGNIFINNDSLIELIGLKNSLTDSYVNDATVTVTLYDSTGAEVSGISWPLTMAYVTASNGDYRGTLDKAVVLITGALYKAVITALDGINDGEWVLYLRAQERA